MAIVQADGSHLPALAARNAPQSWADGQWRTYTLQWGPGFVSGYQDGVKVGTVITNIPSWKMHPILQNEWYTRPDATVSGHTQITRITYDASYTIPPSAFK